MVISASRRTDIPAFFSDWFLRALKSGTIAVRHPFNPSRARQVSLERKDVDAFVFWTRNPTPFFPVLDLLDEASYPYYFLITVNGYPAFLESGSPALETAAAFFQAVHARIGAGRIVWRYDPVVFTPEMDLRFHQKNFSFLAERLGAYCRRVIVSFVDHYARAEKRLRRQGIECLWPESRGEWVRELLDFFRAVSGRSGLEVQSCAEEIDTAASGVPAGKCVDEELLNKLFGLGLPYQKDTGQRRHCRCHRSIDIGTYRTCPAGCLYCYAR